MVESGTDSAYKLSCLISKYFIVLHSVTVIDRLVNLRLRCHTLKTILLKYGCHETNFRVSNNKDASVEFPWSYKMHFCLYYLAIYGCLRFTLPADSD